MECHLGEQDWYLYHLNDQRLKVLDDPEQFSARQLKLERQVEQMATQRDQELKRPKLPVRAKKVLESLQNHWEGLTRFVTNPGIPMDNNAAEQAIRTGVPGRKNYYGSGSDWSADIAAFLFSIFMTLKLWVINPKIWLNSYLEACAANGRKPPEDISPYLPWLMSEEMLTRLASHSLSGLHTGYSFLVRPLHLSPDQQTFQGLRPSQSQHRKYVAPQTPGL